jgi:hypothetical protein
VWSVSQFTFRPGDNLTEISGQALPRRYARPVEALKSRLAREYRTLEKMVAIYCRDHHNQSGDLPCDDCRAFLTYAEQRLLKCPYGQKKPTCAHCPVHCYKPRQREHARIVMQYSGPRMVLRHPWLSLLHVMDKFRKVEHPMELRRRRTAGPRPGGGGLNPP